MRRAEEKRLRDEEKRKSRTVAASLGVATEPSTTTVDPPALEPIPQLDPISTEEQPKLTQVPSEWPQTGTKPLEESRDLESTAGIQKEFGINAEESIRPEQSSRESSELQRVLAEEPTQLGSIFGESDRAETISLEESIQANRVTGNGTGPEPESKGVQEIPPASSTGLNVAELIAARVLSSPTVSNTSTTKDGPLSSAFQGVTLSSNTSKASTKEVAEPSAPLKRKDLIEVRIAPPATTDTMISGPSGGPKSPKGDSKVSSWLKSKFSRRMSKPPKPETNDPESSSGPLVTSVHTTTAGASSSPNRNESLVDEVTTAGGRDLSVDNRKIADDNLCTASGSEPMKKRQEIASSSVSSLSDNDGTRGRSELRREATGSSQSEEFEEARDHFDSEELAPPALFNNNGRASDSPVRDSKFQEDL